MARHLAIPPSHILPLNIHPEMTGLHLTANQDRSFGLCRNHLYVAEEERPTVRGFLLILKIMLRVRHQQQRFSLVGSCWRIKRTLNGASVDLLPPMAVGGGRTGS